MPHHPPQFPLSLYGWTFWVPILITGSLTTLVALFLPHPAACIVGTTAIVLTTACLAFYRDFPRTIPQNPDIMVAPADGTVSEITHLNHYEPFNGPALKVGIFLSIFSVHVNRSPCDAIVLSTRYEEGQFLDARHPDCSAKNQSNTLVLGPPTSNPSPLSPPPPAPIAVVKQIVGAIARRIIAPVTIGERLARGQRFGMIAFGSRTELYVPAQDNWQPAVKLGDGVRAGKSILLRKHLSEAEIRKIASRYLVENPFGHPDYEWELREATELPDVWLFDFCFRCTKDIPPEKQEEVGGAPAFCVNKADGTVDIVSWAEYPQRKKQALVKK